MLVGHLAVGFAAKRVEPKMSLGNLVLASMLADLLWCVFMIAGVERVQFTGGMGAVNYLEARNIALSHSLLMDVIWAAALAFVYFLWRGYLRGAAILLTIVISHWVLDFVSHRPDMPLAPGIPRYFGLGLWTSIPATLIVEGGFWLFAVVLYVRSTRPTGRAGIYAFWSVLVLLTLVWYNNIAGPPPPNPRIAPIFSLVLFTLVVAWAFWMNRLRPAQA